MKTLATEEDRIWPTEKWPAMTFEDGLKLGAKGGHGPIRYSVETYRPSEVIQFRFSKPNGFNGIHKFEIEPINENETQIKHTIKMQTAGKGTLMWVFGICALHNALIEDAFDKFENNFSENKKSTSWNFWVRFLRKQIAKKTSKRNT